MFPTAPLPLALLVPPLDCRCFFVTVGTLVLPRQLPGCLGDMDSYIHGLEMCAHGRLLRLLQRLTVAIRVGLYKNMDFR
jgi:hypothetical protein